MKNLDINTLAKKYTAKYKAFVLPLSILLVILALSATFGKDLVLASLEKRERINVLNNKIQILENKKATLQSLDQTALAEQVTITLRAVPSAPSTLPTLASLKQLATQTGIVIENFNVSEQSTEEEAAAREVSFTFSMQADLNNTLEFLEQMRQTAPLTKVTKVTFSSPQAGSSEVNFVSFWSPISDTLPPTDTSFEALTQSERQAIENLKELRGVTIQEENLPTPQGRFNPFEL